MSGHYDDQHPVTRELKDQWHKLAAAIMSQLGTNSVTLSAADFEKISGKTIVAHAKRDVIVLTLTSEDVARTMADQHARGQR